MILAQIAYLNADPDKLIRAADTGYGDTGRLAAILARAGGLSISQITAGGVMLPETGLLRDVPAEPFTVRWAIVDVDDLTEIRPETEYYPLPVPVPGFSDTVTSMTAEDVADMVEWINTVTNGSDQQRELNPEDYPEDCP